VDNAKYVRSGIAALCRAKADWLVGMNMSRAVTKTLSAGDTVSIGRVQTPTLAMIVNRDLEVEGHVKRHYWVVEAQIEASMMPRTPPRESSSAGDSRDAGRHGRARHENVRPSGAQSGREPVRFVLVHPGRDEDRIEVEKVADGLAKQARGAVGAIEVTRTTRQEAPPPLFTLGSLQRLMNKSHKWSLKRTMDVAEELYLKGVTTYARTECPFLPSEHRGYVDRTLAAVSKLPDLATMAELVGRGPVVRPEIYDDAKVAEHHAIVPTRKSVAGATLNRDEVLLYTVVARRYLASLCADRVFVTTSATFNANGVKFSGRWATTTSPGWHLVEPPAKAENPAPDISNGQICKVLELQTVKRAVEPPKPYTEGTLQKDMDGAAKFIIDEVLRKAMRDGESRGLGTSATQHAIVETLKARGFVVLSDGCLRSTPFGRAVIKTIPPSLYDIGLTARWEQALDRVAKGWMTADELMLRTNRMIERFLADVQSRATGPRIVGAKYVEQSGRRARSTPRRTSGHPGSTVRRSDNSSGRTHKGG
jgi:DNA topoisomerase-3